MRKSLALALFLLVAPRLYSALRVRGLAIASVVRAWFAGERPADDLFDELPRRYSRALPPAFGQPGDFAVRCVTGRGPGVPGGRIAFLCLAEKRLVLFTRSWLVVRQHEMDVGRLDDVRVQRSGLFESLLLRAGPKTTTLYFFRDRRLALAEIARRLDAARAGVVAATG